MHHPQRTVVLAILETVGDVVFTQALLSLFQLFQQTEVWSTHCRQHTVRSS